MTIRFDEKGKFFTDVISKEAVSVIIQMTTHQVHGRLHVRPKARLKDEINQSEQFFAVTEATILNNNGEEQFHCEFMAINRDHVVWLLPLEEIMDDDDQEGGGEP
jgi:hypothetical protein